jgi:hypothetical protein
MECITCPNCGAQVERHFCPECGQERRPSVVPLGILLTDMLEEFLKFDSRLFGSIALLIARPGFLTTEYLLGRRARYLTPLKLYFSVSFAFFLVFVLMGADQLLSQTFGASDVKRLREWLSGNGPWLVALSIPFGAIGLKVLHRKRLYVEHLVFCAHSQSQFLLALMVCLLIPNETASDVALVAMECAWTAIAMRRVYDSRWAQLLLWHLPLLACWYVLFFGLAFFAAAKLAGVRL